MIKYLNDLKHLIKHYKTSSLFKHFWYCLARNLRGFSYFVFIFFCLCIFIIVFISVNIFVFTCISILHYALSCNALEVMVLNFLSFLLSLSISAFLIILTLCFYFDFLVMSKSKWKAKKCSQMSRVFFNRVLHNLVFISFDDGKKTIKHTLFMFHFQPIKAHRVPSIL